MNLFDNGRVDTKLVTAFLYTSSLTVSPADCIKTFVATAFTQPVKVVLLTMEELTQNWLPPSCTLLLSQLVFKHFIFCF